MATKTRDEMIDELRDTQAKIQKIRCYTKQPLSISQIKRLEKLMDQEESLYEELGPEFLEQQL